MKTTLLFAVFALVGLAVTPVFACDYTTTAAQVRRWWLVRAASARRNGRRRSKVVAAPQRADKSWSPSAVANFQALSCSAIALAANWAACALRAVRMRSTAPTGFRRTEPLSAHLSSHQGRLGTFGDRLPLVQY